MTRIRYFLCVWFLFTTTRKTKIAAYNLDVTSSALHVSLKSKAHSSSKIACVESDNARMLVATPVEAGFQNHLYLRSDVCSYLPFPFSTRSNDSEIYPAPGRLTTLSSQSLILSNTFNQNIAACYPQRVLDCVNSRHISGVCFTSSNNGQNWKTMNNMINDDCPTEHMDLVFLLDGSRSVNADHPDNFDLAKLWIRDIVAKLGISKDGKVSVGVVQYSHYYSNRSPDDQPDIATEIGLGQYTNIKDFSDAMDRITLQGLTTYTAHALLKTIDDFKQSSHYNETTNKKILILITDGRSNDGYLLKNYSEILRSHNITCFAVGIKNAALAELRVVAGSDARVFSVEDFNALQDIASNLLVQVKQGFLEGKDSESMGSLRDAQIGFALAYGMVTFCLDVVYEWCLEIYECVSVCLCSLNKQNAKRVVNSTTTHFFLD